MHFYSKYLSRIDKLFDRCYKLGYCLKQHSILDIRRRDMKLCEGSLPPTPCVERSVTSPENTADENYDP